MALGATESLQIYFCCITGLLLSLLEVWLGLVDLTGIGGHSKFYFGRCDLAFTFYFYFVLGQLQYAIV